MVIRSGIHIRNSLIALLFVVCIGLLASSQLTLPVGAEHRPTLLATQPPSISASPWRPGADTIYVRPGHTVEYYATFTNRRPETQSFGISHNTPEALLTGWFVDVSPPRLEQVQPGERRIVAVKIGVPQHAIPGFSDVVVLYATSELNPDDVHKLILRVYVDGATGPLPTSTSTPTFDPGMILGRPISPTPTTVSVSEAALQQQNTSWNATSDTINVEAGQSVDYAATLTNRSATNQTYDIVVSDTTQLPTGWQVDIDPVSLTDVEPTSDPRNVTISVSVPSDATDGTTEQIAIVANNQATPDDSATITLNVTVGQPQQATVTWDFSGGTSITLPTGSATDIAATLTSSVDDTFAISADLSDDSWSVVVNPTSIDLTADQPGSLTFSVTPPANAAEGDSATLAINAAGASVTAPVEVLNLRVGQVTEQPEPGDLSWSPSSVNTTITAGRTETASASLTSTVSGTVQISTNAADLPAGWAVETVSPTIDLAAGQAQDVSFTITVPANATPGEIVTIQATALASTALAQQSNVLNINVTVAQAGPPGLTWTFTQGTTVAIEEDEDNVEIPSNLTSTVEDTFIISTNIASFPGWNVSINPGTTVDIAADQTINVNFTVSPPDDAEAGDSLQLTVTATGTSSGLVQQELLTINVEAEPVPTGIEVDLTSPDSTKDGEGGDEVTYEVRIRNRGSDRATFRVQVTRSCSEDLDNCADFVDGTSRFQIDGGASRTFDVIVQLPDDATDTEVTTTVRGWVEGDESIRDSIDLVTDVSPKPTETPTNTPSLTPSPTFAPICRDRYEDDDNFDDAVEIGFNLSQPRLQETVTRLPEQGDDRRSICPAGDEDWLKFGAVKGKMYTIDILEMAPGLDLSLELYDEDRRRVAFNDDFYNRTPNPDPANPALPREDLSPIPSDIMPRIDSWTAPHTGQYYIRVRDAAGGGGLDWTYVIAVLTESYGPTPPTVDEVCLDIYEPDGLPEEARLIVSNERQENRRLCPTGDADWVTFFGKAGKRYFMYTNTERYTDNNPANDNKAQAGADTVITLTDRDGVSVLDTNDDIPGGNTLDSQIEFFPEVDGFYFVQVKNVGDIGNQFIRYDLILELCIPGDSECGRVPTEVRLQSVPADLAVNQAAPTPAPVAVVPEEQFPIPEITPTLTP